MERTAVTQYIIVERCTFCGVCRGGEHEAHVAQASILGRATNARAELDSFGSAISMLIAEMERRFELMSAQMEAVNAELAEERKQREDGQSELRAWLVRAKEAREAHPSEAEKKEASGTSKADDERAPSKTEDAGAAAPIITVTAAKAKKSRKKPKQKVGHEVEEDDEHDVEEDDKFLDDAMAKASAERQRHETDLKQESLEAVQMANDPLSGKAALKVDQHTRLLAGATGNARVKASAEVTDSVRSFEDEAEFSTLPTVKAALPTVAETVTSLSHKGSFGGPHGCTQLDFETNSFCSGHAVQGFGFCAACLAMGDEASSDASE